MRPTGELTARAIPGTAGGRAPFFSPNGETLGFFTPEELRTAPLAGGAARTVCEVAKGLGATWSGERIIFSTFETRDAVGLWSVPASGGRPQVLTTRKEGEVAHRWPEAIGDGLALYTVWRSRLDDAAIAELDLASGESRTLFSGGPDRLQGRRAHGLDLLRRHHRVPWPAAKRVSPPIAGLCECRTPSRSPRRH